jgi:predicted nucleic acid-binding protein
VVDASIALNWHFPDEDSPLADRVLARLQGDSAIVPAIWPLEVANGLLVAERRGRISSADTARANEAMLALSVQIHEVTLDHALEVIANLARSLGLTTYDAAYLDLAMREGLALATLGGDLRDAAARVGVPLIE